MSVSEYGARTRSPSSARVIATGMFGTGRWLSRVEAPQSRLSNVITRKPRPSSVSRNSSGHITAGMPRPITSSTAGAPGSPCTS